MLVNPARRQVATRGHGPGCCLAVVRRHLVRIRWPNHSSDAVPVGPAAWAYGECLTDVAAAAMHRWGCLAVTLLTPQNARDGKEHWRNANGRTYASDAPTVQTRRSARLFAPGGALSAT